MDAKWPSTRQCFHRQLRQRLGRSLRRLHSQISLSFPSFEGNLLVSGGWVSHVEFREPSDAIGNFFIFRERCNVGSTWKWSVCLSFCMFSLELDKSVISHDKFSYDQKSVLIANSGEYRNPFRSWWILATATCSSFVHWSIPRSRLTLKPVNIPSYLSMTTEIPMSSPPSTGGENTWVW